jgi:archaetidylinositol phosphate synthase
MSSFQLAQQTAKPLTQNNATDSPKIDTREKTFQHATRIQTSLTSAPERKLLLWLAQRMPESINSDHLTILGFASMFFAGLSYALARYSSLGLLGATVCLITNWFGDSLDGTLARFRNRQRPRYGFYVDHIIDSFGAIFLMTGLAASTYIDWRVAAALLVAFLLLSIESYLATYTLGVFRLSYAKFGPTEIRILLAIANLVLYFHSNARVPWHNYRLLNFASTIATAAMFIMAVAASITHTITLYRQETR